MYTSPYRTLCTEAEAGGHIVKLCRFGQDEWGLELLLAPNGTITCWRAGGFAFSDISELDRHAGHLLDWLHGDEQAHGDRDEQDEGDASDERLRGLHP
jgi:hypothetical protein